MEKILRVDAEHAGERIDKYIGGALPALTRSYIQRLIAQEMVTLGGAAVRSNYKVKTGDSICVAVPEPEPDEALPQDIALEIVYEDEHLLVVNKPQGMVVHPAAGNTEGTLVNALLHHCGGRLSGINGVLRPGIVHRIDKDTSGLLLVAKSNEAHLGLAEQIKAHSLTREYLALVHGEVRADSGTVNAPVGRHPGRRKEMTVTDRGGRDAVTHYRVEQRFLHYTFLALRLETGRTHQIRVHMRYIGHPVAGDPVYGPSKRAFGVAGQLLHAHRLGFTHPVTGRDMDFAAPLPPYFTDVLRQLQAQAAPSGDCQ